MGEREQREHWHLRALEAETLAEAQGREIARLRVEVATARGAECAEQELRRQAEARLREVEEISRKAEVAFLTKIAEQEERLAKVVEAAKILSPNARDHILAAAQPEEEKHG